MYPAGVVAPQVGYGQVALARETVPGDWSDALVTISNEQVRDVVSGTTLMPVPLESVASSGTAGWSLHKMGKSTVRAKRYVWAYLFARTFSFFLVSGFYFGLRFLGIQIIRQLTYSF